MAGGKMARADTGWFKCWRSALEKDLGQNVYLWGLWHALLHMAIWKESQIIWKGERRSLPPGSVIFSPLEISRRWDCSKSVIQKWLKYLHDTGRIIVETCSRGTLVTICNWEAYQSSDDEACSPQGHSEASARPPRGTYEEGKKERSKNTPEFERALAEYKRLPGVQKGPKAEQRFSDQIASPEDLDQLLVAIQNYRTFLSWPENSWRKPKTTFETFLGSRSSGFFWRDFIQLPARAEDASTSTATPLHMVRPV